MSKEGAVGMGNNVIRVGAKSPYRIPDADNHQLIIDGSSGIIILTHLSDLQEVEISGYSDPQCERLYTYYKPRNILFFIWKFGDMHVMDTPFHASANDLRVRFFPFPRGTGFLVTSILVDRNTGIVRGINSEGIGNGISCKLAHALNRQTDQPVSPEQFQREVREIYGRFQSPEDMLAIAEDPWIC